MSVGRRRTVNKDLPQHLKRRGNAYYFDHGMVAGKRTYAPLGHDYPTALRKWAELAGAPEIRGTTFHDAVLRYRIEVLHTVAAATQDSYTRCLNVLDEVFGAMALDKITAELTEEYLRKRSVKHVDKNGKAHGGAIIAAREIAVLSLVFNRARAWGYTNEANPRYGKQLTKARRNVYVTDEQYRAIYDQADDTLKDAMDLAYLIGQRPSDVLRIRRSDIRDGRLEIQPAKTVKSSGAKISIEIAGELEVVLERIQKRPGTIVSLRLFQQPNGDAVTLQMIQRRWQAARAAAGIAPDQAQFRDLRAKAATDLDNLAHAQSLLAHSTRATTEGYVRGRIGEKVKPLNRHIWDKKAK